FTPYPGFSDGLNLAVGDVTNDGHADIVVGLDTGGEIWVYDGATLSPYTSIPTSAINGSTRIAIGDVDGDGTRDIILVETPEGGGSAFISASSVVDGMPLTQFTLSSVPAGTDISVAAADLNGDGRVEIILGLSSVSSQPHVAIYDALSGTLVNDLVLAGSNV